MEVINIQPCPLCSGHKRVFQQALFQQALQASTKQEKRTLTITNFVRDCSVCAGNGWVKTSGWENAKQEAASWRSHGVCQF